MTMKIMGVPTPDEQLGSIVVGEIYLAHSALRTSLLSSKSPLLR